MRFFNTTGPVDCQKQYCLPPLHRFDLAGIESLTGGLSKTVLFATVAPI